MVEETTVLRALASPVRQRVLNRLGQGSATSAMLARLLDSNTGVMSYHLRELGKAGLIERDEARSRGREVYWRLGSRDVRFNDPATSAAPGQAQTAIELILSGLVTSVRRYVARTDLEPRWRDAALFSRSATQLTVEELAAFTAQYLDLVARFTGHRDIPADAHPVRVAMFAYPETYPENDAQSDTTDEGGQ